MVKKLEEESLINSKKYFEKLSTIFVGIIIMVLGGIICSILFYGINKADSLEASQMVFKDQMITSLNTYRVFTMETINCLKETLSKNSFYVEALNEYVEKQDAKIEKQNVQIDRIGEDVRDVNKTVLITMAQIQMQAQQGIQTFRIEEGRGNDGK